MTSPDGDADVKIVDFGFAAFTNGGNDLQERCGSPCFVAPEILQGHAYGKAVDCWSFGVILYVMLSGGLPFYSRDQVSLFTKITSGRFSFDPTRWNNISFDAKDFVSRLLCKNPTHRMTVDEALKHPWLKVPNEALARRNLDANLQQLKKFQTAKKFRAAVHAVMVASYLRTSPKTKKKLLPTPHPSLPHKLENYYEVLEHELGTGEQATVRLGINKITKEEAAIKVFDHSKMSASNLMLLQTEINILKQLNHPNIVQFYDYFEPANPDDLFSYLVMEKIDGGDLFDRIERKTNYSENEAKKLAKPLLLGIKHLHDRNIVHR